jgi:fatty-acid peroxygenase
MRRMALEHYRTVEPAARHVNPAFAAAVAAVALAGAGAYIGSRARRIEAASPFPRDPAVDSTAALVREGYTFIARRCRALGTDAFETRLMTQRAICVSGEDAARMFYVPGRFTRRGAAPLTTVTLLQGMRSVQMLDGSAHQHRKHLFTSLLMQPESVARLAALFEREWLQRTSAWSRRQRVVLYHEANEILTRAVCAWAGVPLAERDVRRRAREFASMTEGAGNVPRWNIRGQVLRSSSERWVRHFVEAVRDGRATVPSGSAADLIASHYDEHGRLIPTQTAVTELTNVLRPTVAIGRFITFAALALHDHPDSRSQLAAGDDEYTTMFVQEVRRFYPFFPAVGGRVLQPFTWRGHHFKSDAWVLLDLYGTNHDPRIWNDPEVFRPERFRDWTGNLFSFVPQGGGSTAHGHRCPGEEVTVSLMKVAMRQLAKIRFAMPRQDLRIDLSRVPALPRSGLIVTNVAAL